MSNRNHPNTAEPVDLSEDDPFAELTRIMGFDPRQPVRQAEPAASQQSVASVDTENAGSDEFSIDLEKEMMGEFETEDDSAPAPRSEASAGELDDPDFGDIDLDLSDDLDAPGAPEVSVAPMEVAAIDDPEIDFELDEAFLAAVEDEAMDASEQAAADFAPADSADIPTVEAPEMAADDAVEFDPDFGDEPDFAPAIEVVSAHDAAEAPAIHMDPAEETEFSAVDGVGDIELDFAADFDNELAASVAGQADADRAEAPPVDATEVAPDSGIEDDLSASFDAALLDSVMEEDAVAIDAAPYAEAGVAPEFVAVSEEILPEIEDFDLEDFQVGAADEIAATDARAGEEPDLTVDEPLESALPVFPLRPIEYPADNFYAGPVEEQAFEAADNDLEDELNALLGNISAASGAASAAPHPVAVAAPDDAAAHETAYGQAEPDLDWDVGELDQPTAGENENADDFQHEAASYESDLRDDSGVEAAGRNDQWTAQDDGRTGPDLDDVPDFDHDDLDAAFASAMAGNASQPLDTQAAWQPSASDQRQSGPREDPLDVIAALTARYSAPVTAASVFGQANMAGRPEDAPDVETIEVQDRAVALADDLDLPEVAYEEETAAYANYDDLDTEFASLLNDMNAPDDARPQSTATTRGGDARAYAQREEDDADLYPATTAVEPGATHAAYDDDARGEYGYDDSPRYAADPDYPEAGDDEFDYDPDADEAVARPGMEGDRSPPPRRGMMIAAIVGGVAIVGGLGAFAMSFGGGSGDDTPVLVRADDAPIKIKPENPGGTTVPNQDNKVYDTVAGTGSTADPQQERLVTTAEEPVDMTPPASEPEPELAGLEPAAGEVDPAAKGEDRIEQILQEAEADLDTQVAAIAPRKVRTMVVNADGTLVPREEPTPVETVEPQSTAATELMAEPAAAAPAVDPTTPEVLAGTPEFTPPAREATGALAPVSAQPAEVPAAQQADFPATVPIAPPRPSEQPVDVVGEVKPDQVAALSPAVTSGGNWSMQIASQPSEAAAQSSYQDLVSRYGSVLNGRPANIVKAEIAGKGTFWRVRVPAQSRNDAIGLCESYKAAGGNCFVSR